MAFLVERGEVAIKKRNATIGWYEGCEHSSHVPIHSGIDLETNLIRTRAAGYPIRAQ